MIGPEKRERAPFYARLGGSASAGWKDESRTGQGEEMIDQTAAWGALAAHAEQARGVHLRERFASEPDRQARFTHSAAGLTLDLSKQRWSAETLELLLALAREAELPEAIRRLLDGERVNVSEDRPALHTALRLPESASLVVEGEDLVPGEIGRAHV